MSRPRLLDLFCGGGGAAMGYHRAGFEVVGVDNRPQPRYPFTFHEADALTFPLDGFDVIHASPPCQDYSLCRHIPARDTSAYPRLIGAMRDRLTAWGGLWVIENVVGTRMDCSITLCGQMFGLGVYRHRQFASNLCLLAPAHVKHSTVMSTGRLSRYFGADADMVTVAGHMFSREAGGRAMQIAWMTRDELAEAIPPAYTEFIGKQLIVALENGVRMARAAG